METIVNQISPIPQLSEFPPLKINTHVPPSNSSFFSPSSLSSPNPCPLYRSFARTLSSSFPSATSLSPSSFTLSSSPPTDISPSPYNTVNSNFANKSQVSPKKNFVSDKIKAHLTPKNSHFSPSFSANSPGRHPSLSNSTPLLIPSNTSSSSFSSSYSSPSTPHPSLPPPSYNQFNPPHLYPLQIPLNS